MSVSASVPLALPEQVAAFDWATTPVGPRASWPAPLELAVQLCLTSAFPMVVLWGDELIQIYNDGYAGILGERHPAALGQATQACWPEVWSINEPLYQGVRQGRTYFFENQLYPITRAGLMEHAYFTLGYSPLPLEAGVGGVMVTVTETSAQVWTARRLQTLRTLSLGLLDCDDWAGISDTVMRVLDGVPETPFVLLYGLDGDHLQLLGHTGVEESQVIPTTIPAHEDQPTTDVSVRWLPASLLEASGPVDLALPDGLTFTDGAVRPHQALVLLVCGLSPHLPLDQGYREHLELIGTQVASALLHVELMQDRGHRQLAERTQELRQLNEELDAFAFSVSHDLRTPLRHIAGFSALLGQGLQGLPGALALERYVRIIDQASERMTQLIENLLGFARQSRAPLCTSRVALHPLVDDVLQELQPDLQGRTIVWSVSSLPTVQGDAALLRVVLSNLLSNALKYTGQTPEAHISVVADASDDEYLIEVRDNGVGFNAQYADRLFKVFQRLHRAEDFEGVGVGLATVQRIVHRHRGRVWAQGVPGKGATFGFALPRTAQGPD